MAGGGHSKNEDQYLDKDGSNEVSAVDAKDAVTKKHIQNTDTQLDSGVVKVSATDNIGIGTAEDATEKLEINGNVKATIAKITQIRPHTDGTTALQIKRADGVISILTVNTSNYRVGIGTDTPESKLQVRDAILSNCFSDDNFDLDVILNMSFSTGYGLVIIRESVDMVSAVYRIEGTTIVTVSANAAFSTTKDNASTYNFYYETGNFHLQNKVGNDKRLRVGIFGI